MRLWTIHPQYLDTRGLLAVWREGLLAQKVLQNQTKGYKSHPQLSRFQCCPEPEGAIANYLRAVYAEAANRRYNFDCEKISSAQFSGQIVSTRGQLLYEWNHLKIKLSSRDEVRHGEISDLTEPEPHPIFTIVEGDIEDWEIR